MTVTLYNNKSASNVLNKSYDVVQSGITATARGSVDVDRPAVILDYSSTDFNYFYISEFSRYYYVTSRTLLPGEHILITGESDPLESFAAAVGNIEALAVRNEDSSKWNRDIPDPLIVTKSKRVTKGYSFGSMQDIASSSDSSYVLGVF